MRGEDAVVARTSSRSLVNGASLLSYSPSALMTPPVSEYETNVTRAVMTGIEKNAKRFAATKVEAAVVTLATVVETMRFMVVTVVTVVTVERVLGDLTPSTSYYGYYSYYHKMNSFYKGLLRLLQLI